VDGANRQQVDGANRQQVDGANRQQVDGANRQQADGAGQPSGVGSRQANFAGPPAAGAGQPAERPGQPTDRSGSRSQGASATDAGAAPPPEAQVRHVLREYEQAWDRLDADGVRRVFPTFAGDSAPGFRNFTLRIENPEIFVNGPHAMVRAIVHHTPRSTAPFKGNGREVPTILRFQLGDDGHWVLKGMQPLKQQQQQQRQQP
jgi:hypothetical protein